MSNLSRRVREHLGPVRVLVCELLVHSQCFMTDPPATTLLPLPHLPQPFFRTCAWLEHGERWGTDVSSGEHRSDGEGGERRREEVSGSRGAGGRGG
jgi:hypothetical protein